jgi:PIN domain nuclease of toxin-antitoxin system
LTRSTPLCPLDGPILPLDTHALLWWLVEPEKLSAIAYAAINDAAATIFVSAASGWEIATKARLGKLPGAEQLRQDLPSLLQQQGFEPLAVPLHHGVHAGGYRQAHRDRFDRLLAAQAELEGLQPVSLDPALATFPCRLLW